MVQEAGRLSPEEVDARLGALLPSGSSEPKPPRRLKAEDVDRRLDALIPRAPNAGEALVGKGLMGLGDAAGSMSALAQSMGAAAGDQDVETPFFSGLEDAFQGAAEWVYPAESRGRGGVFSEDIPGGIGQAATMLIPGKAAKMLGAGAKTVTGIVSAMSSLETAAPLYYDTLAKTGDKLKAYGSLFAGFGLGQLERFGLAKIFEKADDLTGGAAEKWFLSRVLGLRGARAAGAGAREAHTEALEQGLGDAVVGSMSGEDLFNFQRILDVYGPASGVGVFFQGLADSARRMQVAAPSPELRSPTHEERDSPGAASGLVSEQGVPATVGKPAERDLSLSPEDVAAEEQLKGLSEVAGSAIAASERADTNPVSGLKNIAADQRDSPKVIRERRPGTRWIRLRLDGRNIKAFNRFFTHGVGNKILAEIGKQISAVTRPGDLAAHLHGDEYAATMNVGGSDAEVDAIARRLESAVDEVLERHGVKEGAGYRFGVDAAWAEIKGTDEAAFKAADALADARVDELKAKRGLSSRQFQTLPHEEQEVLARRAQAERAEKLKAREEQPAGPTETKAQPAPKQPGVSQPQEKISGPGKEPPPAASPQDEELVQLHAGLPPIGRGGRKLMRGLKHLVSSGFRPRGDAPKEAHRALEIARGEIMSEGEEVRVRAKELNAALSKAKLKGPAADKLVQDALTDPTKLEALPAELKGPVAAIRDHVDRLSDALVREGVVDGPIADVIVKNQGIYLRRSYKAHHDPEWMNNVPEDVRNRTVSLLRSWEEFAGASDQEINAELDSWLQEAKEHADNPWGHLARGKLGRKDLSIFKKRKDLPIEIREFLGEVKDPRTNYAQSVVRMASTIARHKAYRDIRAKGLGKWLSEKPSGKNTARLSSEENRALAPLNGLYTTPEIKKALSTQPTENFGPILDALTKSNAFLKGVKTVYNPDQIGRNFLGNTTNAISNGTKPIPGKRAWRLALGRNLSEEDLAARKELIRLGVLEESAHAAEFHDLAKIESIRAEDLANEQFWAKWKKIPNGLRTLYELMDGSFKVEHFQKEYDAHKKAGFSEKASKERAADLVRDLNPTYSRIFPIVQKMRRGLGPIWGGYLAFHSEQFRILGNRLRVIAEEVRSSNPDVRAMGYKRVASSLLGHSIVPASTIGIAMLQGIDADEDKDRRDFIPPWDQGSQIIWLGSKRGGTYIDLSDIDPHTLWTDPLARILAGEEVDKVLARAIKEYSSPYTQPAPLMEAMWELYTGRDEYGRPIKDPIAHLWKEVRPSTIAQLAKAKERGVALTAAAMAGFRQHQASDRRNKKERE